jgi:hypothetical protein
MKALLPRMSLKLPVGRDKGQTHASAADARGHTGGSDRGRQWASSFRAE